MFSGMGLQPSDSGWVRSGQIPPAIDLLIS